MGTKNNPKNRGKNVKVKTYNSKEVEPILYDGNNAGHGKYMAAKYVKESGIILDSSGRPIAWDSI